MKADYRTASIDAPTRALLDYCVKITRTPWEASREDVEQLREHGFDDGAIHDAVQVCGYFNYINRVADALGIDPEPEMPRSVTEI